MTTVASLAAVYLVILVGKAVLAARNGRRVVAAASDDLSRVVIVQPVLSGDPGLEATLDENVRGLPAVAFLWLVDSDDADGQRICRDVQQRHAGARIDVVIVPPAPIRSNPKLFKLEWARTAVGDRIWLVLDDDARLSVESAQVLVQALASHDIATALPACRDDGRWPSNVLAQFVNNNAALTYLPMLSLMAPVTINGMAYALRATTLDRLGGFRPIMSSITDDLALAQCVRRHGGRIAQTAAPVVVETTVRDARHYARQMHRWYLFAWLLFRQQSPGAQVAIAALNVTPSLLLAGLLWSAIAQPGAAGALVVASALMVRAATLIGLQRQIYGVACHRPVWSVVSECLQPLHLMHALLQRTIWWRTRRYRVHPDQSFEPIA